MNEGYGDYSNRDIRARSFDLTKAGGHFEKAGWGQRGPDGIRSKNGERFFGQNHLCQSVGTRRDW